MLGEQWVMAQNGPFPMARFNSISMYDSYPTAATGLGQITITTGANTLGISSFAYPTAGPSRAGGTGNPDVGGTIAAPAADQALLELESELPDLLADAPSKTTRGKRDVAEAKTPSLNIFASDTPQGHELEMAGAHA